MLCPWKVFEFCLSEVVRTMWKTTDKRTLTGRKKRFSETFQLFYFLSWMKSVVVVHVSFMFLFMFWLSVIILHGVVQRFFLRDAWMKKWKWMKMVHGVWVTPYTFIHIVRKYINFCRVIYQQNRKFAKKWLRFFRFFGIRYISFLLLRL